VITAITAAKPKGGNMGTNYYLEHNHCVKCKRLDEIHIGKNSWGWSFSFHGKRKDEWSDESMEEIKSWQDWKKLIAKDGAIIRNEYDEIVSAKEFIEIVENVKEDDLNHTAYMREDYKKKYGHKYSKEEFERMLQNLWIDEEGYSFQEGEFC
jgi:hypothetical protein